MGLNFLSIISVDKKNVKERIFSLAIGNKILEHRIVDPIDRSGLILMFAGINGSQYQQTTGMIAK